MKYSLITLSLACLAFGCKKSSDTTPSGTYFNKNANSTWDYRNTDNSSGTPVVTTYTLTSTDRDSSINGKSYHVYSNSNGPNSYLNATGNDYYQYSSMFTSISPDMIELLYLKDNLSAGQIWLQNISVTISGFPFPLILTNTVMEKGISRTVNGTTYSNVIRVKTDLGSSVLPPGTFTSDINSYYAPGYGLIETNTSLQVNFGGSITNIDQSTILVSATLH
jgi:hypothetical protein